MNGFKNIIKLRATECSLANTRLHSVARSPLKHVPVELLTVDAIPLSCSWRCFSAKFASIIIQTVHTVTKNILLSKSLVRILFFEAAKCNTGIHQTKFLYRYWSQRCGKRLELSMAFSRAFFSASHSVKTPLQPIGIRPDLA